MVDRKRRGNLKSKIFRRDGWQDDTGRWYAMCGMGCGDVIDWYTAVMDRYPIKKEDGGRYTFDNTRLVCNTCQRAGCNYMMLPPSKRPRKLHHSNHIPRPKKSLSVSECIDKFMEKRQGGTA